MADIHALTFNAITSGLAEARRFVSLSEREAIAAAVAAAIEPEIRADERELIRQMAIRNGAVCTGDEGTSCYFADLIRGLP